MSLVKAETDEGFVAEVGEELSTSCARMNSHVTAMIEAYLRRRIEQVRIEVKREGDANNAKLLERVVAAEAAVTVEKGQHQHAKEQLSRAAAVLQQGKLSMRRAGLFHSWRRYTDMRRVLRQLAETTCTHNERVSVSRAYTLWRLFAAARRQHRLEAEAMFKRDCREQELLGQIETYQKKLDEEKASNSSLNEKLKGAFVRGVCALNREAVQVLHGPDESQEEDVEAIAEILSRDSLSHHAPTTHGPTESTQNSNEMPRGVCPVHHVDEHGNYYHTCFAPGYCEYDRRAASRASLPTEVPRAPVDPSVVRVDPRSSRSFDNGPSVPRRNLAKPSRALWRN